VSDPETKADAARAAFRLQVLEMLDAAATCGGLAPMNEMAREAFAALAREELIAPAGEPDAWTITDAGRRVLEDANE
jgi:hypothetical protein